jgi:hypothetical protein
MTQMKTCSTCKQTKGLDHFYPSKTGKDGLFAVCTTCCIKRNREYEKNHREIRIELQKKTYNRNQATLDHAVRTGEPWTTAEEELLIECWPTETADDIAEVLGRTLYAVRQRAKMLGVRNTIKHPSDL